MHPKVKQFSQDLPWCVEDPALLGSVVANYTKQQDVYLGPWMEKWFENFQYVYGNHNFHWTRKFAVPVDRRDFIGRNSKSIAQRSKTNLTRTVFESLTASLFTRTPDWECIAADDSKSSNRRTKRMLEKLLDCKFEQLEMRSDIRNFVGNFVGYGMSFAKIDFNISGGSVKQIPRMEEKVVPVFQSIKKSADPIGLISSIVEDTNSDGQSMLERRLVPVIGEDGQPITDSAFTGEVRVQILSPFEVTRELATGGAKHAKWWCHQRVMDYDDFYKEYSEMDGRLRYFDEIQPGAFGGQKGHAMRHLFRMQYVTPQNNQSHDSRQSYYSMFSQMLSKKVLVTEWFDAPTKSNPKGRLVVVVNGKCTHITEPSYSFDGVGGWHPFVEANWLSLNPSVMPTGPIDDVTSKNKELNQLDSVIDTAANRNLGSLVLLKNSAGIEAGDITGEPGLVLKTSDPMGAVNYVRDSQPLPPIVPALRDMKKEDIFMNSGAQEAIRGEGGNATSGIQVRLQEEQERKRLTPQRLEVEAAVAMIGKKIITCIQQNCTELEEQTVGYLLRSASGEFDLQDISAFLSNPITFGVDVSIKAGSMQSKSQAAEQQMIMDLMGGPLGVKLQDAGVADRVLKTLGAEALRDKSSVHRDRAARENEVHADLGKMGPDAVGVTIPSVMFVDDDDIHIQDHESDMVENAERLRSNLFEFKMRTQHMEIHKIQKREKAGELPPGTAANYRQIEAQVSEQPSPAVGQVVEQAQQRKDQRAEEAQQKQAQGPNAAPASVPATPKLNVPTLENGAPPQNALKGV
jgi:hypothetical protein